MKIEIKGIVLRDFILGWQDGLVNVLGIVLGIATATSLVGLVLLAGLAAAFAETLAMAGVAYTSSKAARDHYFRELRREQREIEETPEIEVQEIRDIYAKKGFSGQILEEIVRTITSNRKMWLDTMMTEELRLFPEQYQSPAKSAALVGASSLTGSLIPIIPFFLPIAMTTAIVSALVISVAVLFTTGAIKAKLTVGDWRKSGLEMAAVGGAAALAGYAIGLILLGANIVG